MGTGNARLSDKQVYFLMVLTALFWSGAFIAGKISTGQFEPFTLTFLRFFIGLPFIFAILYRRQPDNLWPCSCQWLPLIALGVIGTFGYHAFFFYSLKYTTAINSSLIGATNPMVTSLLAVIFTSEKITPVRLGGMILSFLGVVLVVSGGDLQVLTSMRFNPGDVLMFSAVLCMAVYALLSRRYMDQYKITPLMVTCYTFLVCTVVSLPLMIWETSMEDFAAASWGGWVSILYMAVFASVLGYLFQMISINHIGASKTAIFINLVPVFTIFQSMLFLKEPFEPMKLVSGLVIITGVYLTTRPEKIKDVAILPAASGKDLKS